MSSHDFTKVEYVHNDPSLLNGVRSIDPVTDDVSSSTTYTQIIIIVITIMLTNESNIGE